MLRPTNIVIRPLDRFNWTDFLHLELTDSQQQFVPSILHAIAESKFDPCTPMGIWQGNQPVGFLQYCNFNRTCWISRVIIGKDFQRQGIGREALGLLLARLNGPDCAEIRTSVHKENKAALAFFHQLGFREMGEDEWETVLRFHSP